VRIFTVKPGDPVSCQSGPLIRRPPFQKQGGGRVVSEAVQKTSHPVLSIRRCAIHGRGIQTGGEKSQERDFRFFIHIKKGDRENTATSSLLFKPRNSYRMMV
jgi:hypothetical protein